MSLGMRGLAEVLLRRMNFPGHSPACPDHEFN
jgi:hypothetical protein